MHRYIGISRTRSSSILIRRNSTGSSCWKRRPQPWATMTLTSVPSTFYKEFSHVPPFTTRSSSTTTARQVGSLQDFLSSLTSRNRALLEQQLFDAFECSTPYYPGHPIDPILHKEMGSLGWIRSIRIETNNINKTDSTSPMDQQRSLTHSIQVTLRISTLHPSMDIVKTRISEFLASRFIDLSHSMGWNIVSPSLSTASSIVKIISFRIQQPKNLSPYFIQELEQNNPTEAKERLKNLGPGLQNVLHYVAVYSCKGGVGKSTVAVNLAYELARIGARVGLIDVDIHGPSLPILVKLDDYTVRRSPLGSAMILPLQHSDVKMISLGFVSPNSGVPGSGRSGGAAIMRGPMASKVVTQLLKGTDWGPLDVLILDLPPGTGDVQLTVCQEVQLSGVVSVLTPSLLAWNDAQKGIEMFTSMGVRTLCAVENMAYFESSDGSRHYPFGKGDSHIRKLGLDDSHIFQVPISSRINDGNDSGIPISLARPEDATAELTVFQRIGQTIATELFLLQERALDSSSNLTVSFPDKPNSVFEVRSMQLQVDNSDEVFVLRFYSDEGAYEIRLSGELLYSMTDNLNLSSASGDQHTVHNDSTYSTLDKMKLFPCRADHKGDGFVIHWANGSHLFYSKQLLAKAAAAIFMDMKTANVPSF